MSAASGNEPPNKEDLAQKELVRKKRAAEALASAVSIYLTHIGIVFNDKKQYEVNQVVANNTKQYDAAPEDLKNFYSAKGKLQDMPMEDYLKRIFFRYLEIYSDDKLISPKDEIGNLEGFGSATIGGALLWATAFTIFNVQRALKKYNNNVCTHRLFAVTFMEVMKFSEDFFLTNRDYAKMLGIGIDKQKNIDVRSLNMLEEILFSKILDNNLGYINGKQEVQEIAKELLKSDHDLKNFLKELDINTDHKNNMHGSPRSNKKP